MSRGSSTFKAIPTQAINFPLTSYHLLMMRISDDKYSKHFARNVNFSMSGNLQVSITDVLLTEIDDMDSG